MNASYMLGSSLLNLLTNYLTTLLWFERWSGGDFSVGDAYWRQEMSMTEVIFGSNDDGIFPYSSSAKLGLYTLYRHQHQVTNLGSSTSGHKH